MGMNRKSFGTGARIFSQGDTGNRAYLITSGTVEIFTERDGETVVLATLGPNSVFGEMALLDDSPRMASARALETVQCLAVSTETFREKFDAMDPFLKGIWQSTCKNLRSLARQYVVGQKEDIAYLDGA